jgi:peroxiredoxin
VRFRLVSFVVGVLALVALTVSATGFSSTLQAAASSPPIDGPMIKFVASDPPVPVPETPFISAEGETIKLADYKGRLVLLNFWATWCTPCIRELHSIERLSTSVKDPKFKVVLVSIDRGGAKTHKPFLEKLGITALSSGSDSRAALLRALKGPGIPISLLINPDGQIVGRLIGDAQWDSPAAKALIQYYLDQG